MVTGAGLGGAVGAVEVELELHADSKTPALAMTAATRDRTAII
jgi:hypothetical protein